MLDCLIIGGGPAGMTAAIYLTRFHLDILVIDAGDSRTKLIPETHNHAGFPNGISGAELLARMQQQAEKYGATVKQNKISKISRNESVFAADWGEGKVVSHTVLLATGVVNRRPDIEEALHMEAIAMGRLRYCPVCDGYEVTDRNVAVIGTGERGTNEALFLRSFTRNVVLIGPDEKHKLDVAHRRLIDAADIALIDGPAKILRLDDDGVVIGTAKGEKTFYTVYPALGSDSNSMLAEMVGAKCDKAGSIIVDTHQRTSVEGLYAAGDVVIGLDQISHAMGEAGVAATTIRNDLAKRHALLR